MLSFLITLVFVILYYFEKLIRKIKLSEVDHKELIVSSLMVFASSLTVLYLSELKKF